LTIPSDAQRLGVRLLGALKDCAEFTRTGEPYFWKPKSMQTLARFGLIEQRADSNGYYATERGFELAGENELTRM
jgi:hypothetical protein